MAEEVAKWNKVWSGKSENQIWVHWKCAKTGQKEMWEELWNKARGTHSPMTVKSPLGDTDQRREKSGEKWKQDREDEDEEKEYWEAWHKEESSKRIQWVRVGDVDRIALPDPGGEKIELLNWLSEEEKGRCSEQEMVLSLEEMGEKTLPSVYNCMSATAYAILMEKMEKRDMIGYLPQKEVRETNALHCVPKAGGKLRLIFDGRRVNARWKTPPKVDLPHLQMGDKWKVEKDEVVRVGKLDLSDYYYHLRVPEWMFPYLTIPRVWRKEGWVYPFFKVLPMGLAWAVRWAQQVHEKLLKCHTWSQLLNIQPRGETRCWGLIYIDDVIFFAKGSATTATTLVNEALLEAEGIYKKRKLVLNARKIKWASAEVEVLGYKVDGDKAQIIPQEAKLSRLCTQTRCLLRTRGRVSVKWVQRIVGQWVWWLLIERLSLSLLFSIYRWLAKVGEGPAELWKSVQDELLMLVDRGVQVKKSWRGEDFGELWWTDASLVGGGVVRQKDEDYQVVWHRCWDKEAHINVLELKTIVDWLNKDGSKMIWGRTLSLRIDSMVVKGGIEKGRSSSFHLNRFLRKLWCIVHICDWTLNVGWVCTSRNVADAVSRWAEADGGCEVCRFHQNS